jgi:bifunctional non-homologous end joining protein LigD
VGLSEYRRKRDFTRTPEPAPAKMPVAARDAFVVQKHAATHLHYDLRLRLGDALKCWAIPKGPSLDPREKRLAIEVEDHPVQYLDFEGTIPAGEYGGGTVMIWDEGRWIPETDAAKALADGMIKFRLEGQRLKGRWMLVRSKRAEPKPQWLLIKERDADASPGVHAETFATSVRTGRTMDEIAAGAPARESAPADPLVSAAGLPGAKKAPMPARIRPQLAVPGTHPPEGAEWLHEVKFDGYRLLLFRKGDSVRVISRSGLDWTSKLTHVAAAVRDRLRVDAVLDGEAVMLDSRGVSDFQALQNAIHSRRASSIIYFAFDLPWCDGYDLTSVALEDRRALLAHLIGARQEGRLRFSEHLQGNGPAAFARVCAGGLEGLVCKRLGSPYVSARVPTWVKVKCFNQQEFVVGGYSAPEGTREQFGALLIGYHDSGKLRFAGKVGTGFSAETLKELGSLLRPLARARPAFADPPTGAEARGVTWVSPTLVAQVQYRDWSADGIIRHASFRGLREDIDPKSVVREPAGAVAGPPKVAAAAPARQPPRQTAYRLTHPDRVVYPDRGAGYALTKRQIAEYYEAVAPLLLPHLANRPMAVLRCPDGEGGKSFFQKHPAKGMPASISSVQIPDDKGNPESHLVIKNVEGLLALVQMSVLEFHPWGAPADKPESPDRLVFDLDPGADVPWKQTVQSSMMVREALSQVGLRGFARTSGGKGVHVVVPLRAGAHDWTSAKAFCRAFAETLVRLAPQRFVATPGEHNRTGRVLVDYWRNIRGATAIASYSTRARPGAPVALPVAWDELDGLSSAAAFTVPGVLKRLGAPDPWESFGAAAGTMLMK